MMAVMAGVGHLYGDAGLRHLLRDSGVFAAGTVQQILSGKDFDRGLYAMKILDEVLYGQFFRQFILWCGKTGSAIAEQVLDQLAMLFTEYNEQVKSERLSASISTLSQSVEESLVPLITMFREEGCEASATFRFWDEFMQYVSTPIKVFLSATRNGNWPAYQSAKAQFLPLLFASNRSTYAKYLPVLMLMTKRLPSEVLKEFEDRQFVAKLSKGKFNGTWIDYTLEVTANKALKGVGGIIGLTLRGSVLARWFMARPVTAKYSTRFQEGICKSQRHERKQLEHHSLSKAEIKRWNSDVRKMTDMFSSTYVDPFNVEKTPKELINFATGVIARPEVQESLLGALDKGKKWPLHLLMRGRCALMDRKCQKRASMTPCQELMSRQCLT